MTCVAPSAQSWRNQIEDWDDDYLARELRRAWIDGKLRIRDNAGSKHIYHDWTNFRTATLREARRRGLDLSVARK